MCIEMVEQWEYAVRVPGLSPIVGNELKDVLDEMGDAGWELFSVVYDQTSCGRFREFYFKRLKQHGEA